MTKQIITLSDNAAQRIKEIMSNAKGPSIGVRIGVKSGGCAGMSYVMEYAKSSNSNDEVIEDKGVKVLIDPSAVMYLLGTEMDYKKEELSSTFVFKNPNETERCGCGESFKV
jgi:iron-sulfur cluster assembly protein